MLAVILLLRLSLEPIFLLFQTLKEFVPGGMLLFGVEDQRSVSRAICDAMSAECHCVLDLFLLHSFFVVVVNF